MPKPTAGANPSPRSTAAAAGSAAAGMRRSQSTYGRCSPGSYSRSAIAGPLRRIASTPAAASAPMTSADMRSTARLIAVSSMAAGSPRRPGMRRSVEQACDDHAHTIAAMPAGGSILNARVHWWLHHLSDIAARVAAAHPELLRWQRERFFANAARFVPVIGVDHHHGNRYYVRTDDPWIGRVLFLEGSYEAAKVDAALTVLSECRVPIARVLDIGANIGVTT